MAMPVAATAPITLHATVVADATHVLFRTELEGTVAALRPFLTR